MAISFSIFDKNMKQKIYSDTSAIGGCFDKKFKGQNQK